MTARRATPQRTAPRFRTILPVRAASLLGPLGAMAMLFGSGCSQPPPDGSIVLTQVPAQGAALASSADLLDQRYPEGSRVVLLSAPLEGKRIHILSKGLTAAGDPVISPEGDRVLFVGKATAASTWQIYEAHWNQSAPKRLTSVQGGAMSPAALTHGDIIYSSPVPRVGELKSRSSPSALYRQETGGRVQQLTFGLRPALEPTVLSDGRILFTSPRPNTGDESSPASFGLFTINSDGTEVSSFALDREGAFYVRRPRELPGGRVGYLHASRPGGAESVLETIRTARPFASRRTVPATAERSCRSAEARPDGSVLVCLAPEGGLGRAAPATVAVYSLRSEDASAPALVFDDPAWHEVEAVSTASRRAPMGHISAIAPGKTTGTILCLDANFVRKGHRECAPARAERVRVFGADHTLWTEMAVQPDGSFMAEVPADKPFGLETLDAAGQTVLRLEPSLWVRPGENRACIGCHEPPNQTPRNRRPLAVNARPTLSKTEAPVTSRQVP